MKFLEYPDREMMMMDLANKMAGEINGHLMSNDTATLAVPGGTTPGPVFDALCGVNLDWSRVRVLLTDERWVPPNSDRSNTRLLRSRLLVDHAAAATLVPMYADTPEPEDCIEALGTGVAAVLPISVLLLGMGEDMHTASLFPRAEGLEAALSPKAPPLLPIRTLDQPEARLTLTAPVLKAAMSIHLLLTGSKKREALERAQRESNPMTAPATAVLGDATIHWAE